MEWIWNSNPNVKLNDSLIISESALELIPFELKDHPSVISHARKLGKYSSEIFIG